MVNATPDIPPEIGEAIMALHQIAARKRHHHDAHGQG
jgi:hypothetical protein